MIGGTSLSLVPQAAHIRFPCIERFRRLPRCASLFGVCNRRTNGARHRGSDFILHGKDVGYITIVTFSPDVVGCPCLDQLGADPNSGADTPHTALKDVTDSEFLGYPFHVPQAVLVGEAGRPCDYEQP